MGGSRRARRTVVLQALAVVAALVFAACGGSTGDGGVPATDGAADPEGGASAGQKPVLKVADVPADDIEKLDLPKWGAGSEAPPDEWPAACDFVPELHAARIVPLTTHQDVEESGPECRRELWFADSPPDDDQDVAVEVEVLFAGGAKAARDFSSGNGFADKCPAGVDRELVDSCGFSPIVGGNYEVRRKGVVVAFKFTAYPWAVGRWEGMTDERDQDAFEDAYEEYFEQEVGPRFVNAAMARVP
jgi:hypothetical protein